MSDYTTVGLKPFVNALAWRYDVYRSCQNACTYCFARAIEFGALARLGIKYDSKVCRVGDINGLMARFEEVLGRETIDSHDFIDWCVARRWMPECGTMGEPFQDFDKQVGLAKTFLLMLNNYQFPLFVCTKANLLVRDEKYYDLLVNLKPYGLVVDVSLISLDDKKIKRYEPLAPKASERLKLIERLCSDGVDVTISCRPFMADLTDLDFDNYIETLCKLGIKSIHIRQFYISGRLARTWKKWADSHRDILIRYGVGWKYKHEYLEHWFRKAQKIAEPYDVTITGGTPIALGKSHKTDFQKLGQKTRDALFPYTVNPIHERYFGCKEPKIMRYDEELEPMLRTRDPMLDVKIDINRKTIILVNQRCTQIKPRVDTRFLFRDLIRKGIWDGWNFISAKYFPAIASAYDIKVVVDTDENFVEDDNGHRIYAFLPNVKGKKVKIETLKGMGLDI